MPHCTGSQLSLGLSLRPQQAMKQRLTEADSQRTAQNSFITHDCQTLLTLLLALTTAGIQPWMPHPRGWAAATYADEKGQEGKGQSHGGGVGKEAQEDGAEHHPGRRQLPRCSSHTVLPRGLHARRTGGSRTHTARQTILWAPTVKYKMMSALPLRLLAWIVG